MVYFNTDFPHCAPPSPPIFSRDLQKKDIHLFLLFLMIKSSFILFGTILKHFNYHIILLFLHDSFLYAILHTITFMFECFICNFPLSPLF